MVNTMAICTERIWIRFVMLLNKVNTKQKSSFAAKRTGQFATFCQIFIFFASGDGLCFLYFWFFSVAVTKLLNPFEMNCLNEVNSGKSAARLICSCTTNQRQQFNRKYLVQPTISPVPTMRRYAKCYGDTLRTPFHYKDVKCKSIFRLHTDFCRRQRKVICSYM